MQIETIYISSLILILGLSKIKNFEWNIEYKSSVVLSKFCKRDFYRLIPTSLRFSRKILCTLVYTHVRDRRIFTNSKRRYFILNICVYKPNSPPHYYTISLNKPKGWKSFIFMVIVRFVSAPGYDNIGLMSEFMSDRFHFVTRLKHGEFYCRYKPDLCLTSGYTMRVAWLIDKTASTVAISKRRYPFFFLFFFRVEKKRRSFNHTCAYVNNGTHVNRRSIKFCVH